MYVKLYNTHVSPSDKLIRSYRFFVDLPFQPAVHYFTPVQEPEKESVDVFTQHTYEHISIRGQT